MADWWDGLGAGTQDALILVAILAPGLVLGAIICRGLRLRTLLGSLLRRYPWTNLGYVALVALSVGLGVGLIAQERGLRQASARVAAKFDLILAAPGDEIAMLMATVYLQPTGAPLLDGATWDQVSRSAGAALVAPIAYGDSGINADASDVISHLKIELPTCGLAAAATVLADLGLI